MALIARQSAVSQRVCSPATVKAAPVPRSVRCKAYVPVELIAAAGDVDAPIAVPIVAGLVVTAVLTFAVPAYLNRGQEAADKIFASRQQKPLDKAKTTKGKTTKGKTTSSKRR